MTDGRTYWWSKDAAWWRREYIVELGTEFGAVGPAVLDYLACEAKTQNDGGRVKAGYRALARGAFLEANDPGIAAVIVGRAAELGALDDLEVLADGRRFTCRVSGWRSDQDRAQGAERSRRARETSRPATPANASSRSERNRDAYKTPHHTTENGNRASAREQTAARRREAAERLAEQNGAPL